MLAYSLTVTTAQEDGRGEPLLVETIPVHSDTEAVFIAQRIFSAFVASSGHGAYVAALKDDSGDLVWRSDA